MQDPVRPLLRRAREAAHAPVVRADMRALPFAWHAFDVVVNLFTSFGYFEDDAEHQGVVDAVAHLLAPGGQFVLDFLNAERVCRTLVPEEACALGDTPVTIRRRVTADRRFVEKNVIRTDDGRGWHERVRLFTPGDLEAMAVRAGLRVRRRLGNYAGDDWHDEAPRTILVLEPA